MAVGEAYKKGTISQVSWTDGVAQDVYYGQEHSFQYSANINCDDEMHGIKLANKAIHTSDYANCHLVSLGDKGVATMPLDGGEVKTMKCDGSSFSAGITLGQAYSGLKRRVPGTVFQDRYWWGGATSASGCLFSYNIVTNGDVVEGTNKVYVPFDHMDSTDESIENKDDTTGIPMSGGITAILNYNNTRLVVASGSDIWVYYPELDTGYEEYGIYGKTGWKKVLTYEAGVTIVALTCTFEYLKVWAVDEGWNTKVYYYQGNNNLRSTFVYNVIDLTGERVLHVYSLNGTDYYTTSIDGTDGYVNLNKMIGNVPVQLLHQRAGLAALDINFKAPYFVGPTGIDAAYKSGRFYIADAYGIFQFRYSPSSYDKGYMKWQLSSSPRQVSGVCENQGFLYVSDNTGCWAVRLYDTGVDGYQDQGILISREYEGQYGGCVTKMLDEIRLNYEMNPLTEDNGSIDIYVSPNNLRTSTTPEGDGSDGWYHVMHLNQVNAKTRTEVSYALNNYINDMPSAFGFDWQTITYAIVITLGEAIQATPIVRQINLNYHIKDKTNNVYDIN